MTATTLSRRCEVCGGRHGAITCYRTAFRVLRSEKSYAHAKCFIRFRRDVIDAKEVMLKAAKRFLCPDSMVTIRQEISKQGPEQ